MFNIEVPRKYTQKLQQIMHMVSCEVRLMQVYIVKVNRNVGHHLKIRSAISAPITILIIAITRRKEGNFAFNDTLKNINLLSLFWPMTTR